MKKAIKKTAKVARPKYVIDMRDVNDAATDFIYGKMKNCMPFNNSDANTIASIVHDFLLKNLMPNEGTAVIRDRGMYYKYTVIRKMVDKLPWYKRLWNWITRKK